MSPVVRPVILSGGSGTRLWPLSTSSLPKQFIPLPGGSLFSRTMARIEGLSGMAEPIVVTGAGQLESVRRAVKGARLLVEPEGRNTAPAVLAAALSVPSDEVLLVLPSDHLVLDEQAFREAVTAAVGMAGEGWLVTFGVRPDRPETGYGYIEPGDPIGAGYRVAGFREKPGAEEAAALLGTHLWNSGMFVFTAGAVVSEGETHCHEIVSGARAALTGSQGGVLGEEFLAIPAISLDHAVMEHTERAVVLPVEFGWTDLGSWESVWEISERGPEGNATSGPVTLIGVSGSYVHATTRPVAVAGLADVVVVETENGVLVVPRSEAQLVRDLVARLGDADE